MKYLCIYQRCLVTVSFWWLHGFVPYIASPLTFSHCPTCLRRSSNIGMILPSCVGPIFIRRLPPQLRLINICIKWPKLAIASNTRPISVSEQNAFNQQMFSYLTVSTIVVIISSMVRNVTNSVFLLYPHEPLSIVMQFSHLCGTTWPRKRSILTRLTDNHIWI